MGFATGIMGCATSSVGGATNSRGRATSSMGCAINSLGCTTTESLNSEAGPMGPDSLGARKKEHGKINFKKKKIRGARCQGFHESRPPWCRWGWCQRFSLAIWLSRRRLLRKKENPDVNFSTSLLLREWPANFVPPSSKGSMMGSGRLLAQCVF